MIPDFQTIMLPLLRYCAEQGTEVSAAQVREAMSQHFKLSEEERQALLPSGRQATMVNRISWAKIQAGLKARSSIILNNSRFQHRR